MTPDPIRLMAEKIVDRHRGVPGWTRESSIADVESLLREAINDAFKEGVEVAEHNERTFGSNAIAAERKRVIEEAAQLVLGRVSWEQQLPSDLVSLAAKIRELGRE